jgi:hypothetical protein
MEFFISLSTFNWRHSPKSLSSAETDLVESTTVQQLWAGVTTKKLILDIFSIRPNCPPRVSRSSRHTQVMLQTVTLCDCFELCLWTTTFVDDWTTLIHYTFFKTKCNFRSLKKYFIDKYIYFKILSLIQNIFNII